MKLGSHKLVGAQDNIDFGFLLSNLFVDGLNLTEPCAFMFEMKIVEQIKLCLHG